MDINQLLRQTERRRLEFKGEQPTNSDLAKTIVAFANDAGGEIYIGIADNQKVVGLPEEELTQIEEQISNMIYDRCYPTILPEISFLTIEDKHIIRIQIYRGSMPPYYLKSEGRLKGTYIRVGSNNRVADESIIAELERKRRNVSFDSDIVMDITVDNLNIEKFKLLYKEKTNENLDIHVLRKLELIKKEQENSLTGKDIKVAIYDDMVEITSPGLLPPSIDYAAMESRQSDARNKVIAPVFKRLGIIDQWGNGLKLVAEEMKEYPEIEFRWKELGLSFQVQFIKRNYESNIRNRKNGGEFGGDGGDESIVDKIIALITKNDRISVREIADGIGLSKRKCERIIAELKKKRIINRIGSARTGRWIIYHK